MGAFDDLIPQQDPAPTQSGTGLFDDLVPAGPDAPSREASLGERFMVNAGQGFEGTLAGQAVENWQNVGNRRQAQADTVRQVLRVMADQGLDAAPATLPNPAQGGTPAPEGPDYLGVGTPTEMPGIGTGDLAGLGVADLEARLADLEAQAAEGQAAYEAERAPVLERRREMPSWYEEEGVIGKGLAGAAALAGQLAGGTPSPENLLAFGRGASLAGRLGRGAAGGAAGAGVAEPVVQQQEVRRGEREAADPVEGAINVALGGAVGGALNVTPDMARAVRRFIAGRRGKNEAEVTPEDVQAFDPEELMQAAQGASEAQAMDPDALGAAIQAATGDARERIGEGMAPQDARRARRDVERELGQAFEATDVYRRQDVEPGEEDLNLREGAEPLRDPTGEQATPESYGARSLAARTATELGVELDDNGIRLAARDIQADPDADPAAIVRSYSREGRESAFESAERRRARREEDLATGENVDRQASTYRAAEEPYERQGRREVTLLGARRDRRGNLVGGEAVEVLARGQRQTPDGGVQDMARIVRGDEEPVWVPADELETVETPENPRMYGEALGQTRTPPRGVGTERGDSPEGFDASQAPQPRRAVDRQADPDGLRRGLFQEGEAEPQGPQGGRAERGAETFDGNTGRRYREADTTEMTPQGEVRTEFQGEGGEMPVSRTRRPVRETASYEARMREPDPEGELNLDTAERGDPDDMDAYFERAIQDAESRDRRTSEEDTFENDTRVWRTRDTNRPMASDQRTRPIVGTLAESYANTLGREDLIHGTRDGDSGWRQTEQNLIGAGYLDAQGRFSVDALDTMDAAERQRLLDRMASYQRWVDERRADPDSDNPVVSYTVEEMLDVADTYRRTRGTPEAQPRQGTAQPDTPPAEAPAVNANAPERLAEPEMAQALRDSVQDFGWAERGGNLLRDQEGRPRARTRWIPYREELMEAVKGKRLTKDGYAQLVERALDPGGRPLTNRQRGIVDDVLDALDPRAREAAEAEADAYYQPDDFDLEAQTEASTRADEQRTREAEDAERRQRLNEERRAEADREADDFVLTGSDRVADEAMARGQDDLLAQSRDNAAQGDTPTSRGGTQLYSGIPLDRIAAAVKRATGGERRAFGEMTERIGLLLESAREAAGGASARNRSTKRSPLTDLWRVTLGSLDGDLRTLVGKFDSPTLKSIPDMFHATAGRGDGVERTFDEAVQARNNPRLQEVDRIMSALRDAKLSKLDQQERIIKLLENPRARRSGEMGKIADRIERFLKEELDYLRKAGVDLGEVRDGYFPREADSGKASADPDGFIRAATRAYKAMGAKDADAKAQAEAYWESVVYGASGKPGAPRIGGQTPSFVQSRQFSKAAAEHLKAYRVRDIDAVLSQYVMRATKRGEIARRFGDNWRDWADIEARIKAEDPDAGAILPLVRDRVALSAGVNLHGLGAASQHSLSALRTWTTLATLPKAAMSSVGELVIAPWRGTTGSIPADLGNAVMNVLGHLGNFSQTISGLGRSEKMEAAFEMAEDIGIIAGTGHNSLMAARFAGGDPVGRVQSEVLSAFFRRNLLEGLTNYTRVTSMRQGQVFLRRVAKQMERHPERSAFFLRELGIPRGQEADFAAYVRDFGSDLPASAAVSGRHAAQYRTALQRFTDQTVMRPSGSTKPKYASHPLGAVIFQLQAFAYAFQKNVLNRQARLMASKDLSYADKLAFSLAAIPSVALLVGVQGLMRDARDALFDPDVRERKTTAAHLEGAISQAGLLGIADPYLQSLTGIRYQRNPLASFMGPAASGLAESTMALSQGALNNSDNTNTGERNLAQATYDWLLEPMAQTVLTAAPSGPVTGKLASAFTVYGVPKGRDAFTNVVAGERNSSRQKPPIQGTIEWLLGDEADTSSGRGSGRDGSRSGGRSSGRDGGR